MTANTRDRLLRDIDAIDAQHEEDTGEMIERIERIRRMESQCPEGVFYGRRTFDWRVSA